MLLLSWNVAGLKPLAHRIQESYSNKNGGEKQHASAAFAAFFHRHGADLVCLQEHKIPKSQLSNRSEPLLCSNVQGFESFWACCTDEQKKGLNGVVTVSYFCFVRFVRFCLIGVRPAMYTC
jgi:exonuclease III